MLLVVDAEDDWVSLDKSLDFVSNVLSLDWKMPMMSGIEYLIAIRFTGEGNKPVAVFCSAETIPPTSWKALPSGETHTS